MKIPFQYTHILSYERFEMEDHFASHANAMLVECRPLDNVCLERVIGLSDQFEGQGLPYSSVLKENPENKLPDSEYGRERLTLRIVVGGMQWVNRS